MTTAGRDANKRSPYLVILDIDDTLIHSSEKPLATSAYKRHVVSFPNSPTLVHVYLRPGVRRFIAELSKLPVRIAVWTAATKSYAIKILDIIFPDWRARVDFLWTRARCRRVVVNGGGGGSGVTTYIKDLRTVPPRTTRDTLLLVDDSSTHETYNRQAADSQHAVWRVRPFTAAPPPHDASGAPPPPDPELHRVYKYVRHCAQHRVRFSPSPHHLPASHSSPPSKRLKRE